MLDQKNVLLWIFVIFFSPVYVRGQSYINLDRMLEVKEYVSDQSHVDMHIDNKSKDYYLFYWLYKTIFSTQDVPNACGFYPSCSTYGLNALKKWGFIRGTLATFDRLQRCNNFHYSGQYIFDETKNKYIDAVSDD